MTDLRTAAQQALKVMESAEVDPHSSDAVYKAITALRAALAEPVQEPVAWVECDGDLVWNNREAAIGRNLYISPQPQQTEPSQDTPPQHEYEVTANDDGTFSVALPDGEELRIIPPQRPAEPVQEPVAWSFEARHIDTAFGPAVSIRHPGREHKYMRNVKPLYTSPPQRKPLTEEEIIDLWAGVSDPESPDISMIDFARAVERAHGIVAEPVIDGCPLWIGLPPKAP